MLIKHAMGRFAGLVAAAALALLGGCSTPCGTDGRLCAPIESNTSVQTGHGRPIDVVRPAAPAATVETMPVENPSQSAAVAPGGPVIRIGLLLPLRSEGLGAPSEALRAGFMAAYERDRAGFVVNIIETGDGAQETLDAYKSAVERNDIVVGPLARSAVGAIASSGAVSKPTIALNHPEGRAGANVSLPHKLLVMGLSIEDEARQVAQWAARENPRKHVMIISGGSAWQRRIAGAFAAHWKQLGSSSEVVELAASNGYLSESGIAALKTQISNEPPSLFFAALDASQLRQVREAIGPDLPLYGTSSVNPGTEAGNPAPELDGLRLLDMPWEVQPDHPAVMIYPRYVATARSLDMDRLYALGIDAFRVAREVALHPSVNFDMDGVTGQLKVNFGNGPARFERVQPVAVYQNGGFKPVGKGR